MDGTNNEPWRYDRPSFDHSTDEQLKAEWEQVAAEFAALSESEKSFAYYKMFRDKQTESRTNDRYQKEMRRLEFADLAPTCAILSGALFGAALVLDMSSYGFSDVLWGLLGSLFFGAVASGVMLLVKRLVYEKIVGHDMYADPANDSKAKKAGAFIAAFAIFAAAAAVIASLF